MSLTTSELVEFTDFCKKNNFNIPVESLETFLKFKIQKDFDSMQQNINYLYYLIPKDREDQNTLRTLIHKYFQIEIENVSSSTFQIIDEYRQNQALLDILENINSGGIEELNRISIDLITNDIDADFSRPVSDLYWLNQIKKTKKYKEILSIFDNFDMSTFSQLTNELNKNNFERLLDNSILEKIRVERNKQKSAYKPSELEPKNQLNETDFLFTNQDERKLLLEQTYQLGNKLAVKYKRYVREFSKGKLFSRKTIRKSLASGGVLQNIIFKPRIRQKPKLTIICDISGSMALNSLFGVTLLYGMVTKFASIRAYVFIDGITDISKNLRHIKKNEIETIFSRWSEFVKSDGHSDYQKSFEELIESDTSEKGTLIVIGDARNNYRNISENLIVNLSNKYKKIFWINPEQKKYWNTGDSQMKKFQEINFKTSEVRNYKQLKSFIKELDFKKVLTS